MRTYKNSSIITQKKHYQLRELIAKVINYLWLEDKNILGEKVKSIAISVFDHWLSHDEACSKLIMENKEIPNYIERLAKFNLRLYKDMNAISFKKCGIKNYQYLKPIKPNNIKLREFISSKSFINSAKENPLFFDFPTLVMPDHNLVYRSGFDYTK